MGMPLATCQIITGKLRWTQKYFLPIKASQNLSSSALSSDSVGSTMRVPTTGQEVVGEWKPVTNN